MPDPQRKELTKAQVIEQRNEYKAEADRLAKAGKYLAAALRFYVPYAHDDYRRDAFYKDFYDALRTWDDALGRSS